MKSEYTEEFLINEVSKFTRVFKKEKIIEMSDKLYNDLLSCQLFYLNELKKLKYMLQYFIT